MDQLGSDHAQRAAAARRPLLREPGCWQSGTGAERSGAGEDPAAGCHAGPPSGIGSADRCASSARERDDILHCGEPIRAMRAVVGARQAAAQHLAQAGALHETHVGPRGGAVVGFVVGSNREAGYPQAERIETNFSKAGMLKASWGSGALPAPEAGHDGAFRFICKPSHLSYDDPIIYPGQKGRAHLHMFFGNTMADANSDYTSLRTTGESTCNNALNRSAYWIPALLNGRGQVIQPEAIAIYYKRWPKSHPHCQVQGTHCIGLPRGLRYVFGRTMDGKGGMRTYFTCDAPGADNRHWETLVEAAKVCPVGGRIGAVAMSPSCWDGKHLDSPDHRSHMADIYYESVNGQPRCPSTHPYRLPTFTLGAWFLVDETLDRSGNPSPDVQTWYFSSDRMKGMPAMPSGATFHADWYGAWDDDVMQIWLDNCIDKQLSCSGGDLGNGTQIASSEAFNRAHPRLVPIPPDPKD
ncbi:DUF1996 domain-containing protein [Leptolyngbya sp. 15MV]|nr:DUF1996 domain-containing protein [Leptolyngbya sp. 15MV]